MLNSHKLGQKQRDRIWQMSIKKLNNRDKIIFLLQYGILAPSTHNTQPWKFKIKSNTLKIFADFNKKIPIADPTSRDMYISIGALIKNIELAAQEYRIKTNTVFLSDSQDKEMVAEMNFDGLDIAKDPRRSEILQGILKRQNYRGFFQNQFNKSTFDSIVRETFSQHKTVKVTITQERNTVEWLANLTVEGLRAAYAMPEFRLEIGSLINNNFSRKRYGLHGYSLRMNAPQSFIIPQIVKRKDVGAKLGVLNYKSFITSPAVMVLSTKKDDRDSWLSTGQAMEEFMVRAASSGMATSIYTAAIEMSGLRTEVSNMLNLNEGDNPQILFCVGKPGSALHYSVRRNISKVLT